MKIIKEYYPEIFELIELIGKPLHNLIMQYGLYIVAILWIYLIVVGE